MTQAERILDYMKRYGTITTYDAFLKLGITKLATRISEMRKRGMRIESEIITAKNRYGENVHYMRYSLPAEE